MDQLLKEMIAGSTIISTYEETGSLTPQFRKEIVHAVIDKLMRQSEE